MNQRRYNPVSVWIGEFAEDVDTAVASVKIALLIHARNLGSERSGAKRSQIAERILEAIAARRGLGSRFDGTSVPEKTDDLDEHAEEALFRFEACEWSMSQAWEALGGNRREIGLAERRKA